MILNQLLNHRLIFPINFLKRLKTFQSDFDLATEMKLLNDRKQFEKTLELFTKYKNNNNIENCSNLIITQALKACAHTGDIQRGSNIHNMISSRIKDNSYILTSLIYLYMKCGDITRAQSLFNSSTKKILPMYGAMMKGYIENKMINKAIDLFNEIKNPDEVIIILLFNACAQLRNNETLYLIKRVLSKIPESFYLNFRLLTSLLDALMQCGDVEYAQSLFDRSTKKTLSMYGAMMKGYIQHNMANKAIELFNEIKTPDDIVTILLFNACAQLRTIEALDLIKKVSLKINKCFYSNPRLLSAQLDALIKCEDCLNAEILFSKMKRSLIDYGNLMNGFNKENNPKKILELFNQMKNDGIEADLIIYLHLIKALSQISVFSLCELIIQQIPNSFLFDQKIQTALIDMWGKTGYVDKSKQIFENILQLDHFGYTAMINAYGLNGMGIQAIELFRQMPSEFIHEITYVCILNACSHSGLINEARSIFRNIQNKTPRMYNTMIDCLSRASFFEEAQKLIDEFEHHHSPICPMYMSLLSGARNKNNSQLAQQVFDRMKKHFPDLTDPLISATVLLSNVYASSGEIEKALDIRIPLNNSNVKKKIGLSWTSINGKFAQFRAHDQSHPQSSEVYAEVERMSKELIKYGHQYDSIWITRPLNENETVASVLSGHSEKLAIAWNFVQDPNVSKIHVSENLRICGDCHRAAKLIAVIRQCEIIIRDANRIHHFYKNGQCSCNDYF